MVTNHFPEDVSIAVRWWPFICQRMGPLQSDDHYPFTRGRGLYSKMVTIHFPEDGPLQSDDHYTFPRGRVLCSQMMTIHFLEDGAFAVRCWLSIYQMTVPLQSDSDYPFTKGRGLCSKMVPIHLPGRDLCSQILVHFPENRGFAVRLSTCWSWGWSNRNSPSKWVGLGSPRTESSM